MELKIPIYGHMTKKPLGQSHFSPFFKLLLTEAFLVPLLASVFFFLSSLVFIVSTGTEAVRSFRMKKKNVFPRVCFGTNPPKVILE